MELRELKYFLAVAREENISKAAEFLFIAQPSLSRQMQNLEKEIGKPLFVRGGKKITLTETGILLRKRAEEILSLYEKTESELFSSEKNIGGTVFIGSGESYTVEIVAQVARDLQKEYPDIKFDFFSGDNVTVSEMLDKGLIDFGVLVKPTDLSKFDYVNLPQTDVWGVLMRKDSPLAEKPFIVPEDLHDLPLILSKQSTKKNEISEWYKKDLQSLNIVATYNLIFNASLLVKSGLGYAVGLDKIINTTGDSELTFRPLKPRLETSLAFAWKRYQVFGKPAELFLERLKDKIQSYLNLNF